MLLKSIILHYLLSIPFSLALPISVHIPRSHNTCSQQRQFPINSILLDDFGSVYTYSAHGPVRDNH